MSKAKPSIVAPPQAHSIVHRPVTFNITDETPRHWFDSDPFKTHFYNALFTTFPPGENFFVRSVMHFRHQVEDPELQKQINEFAGQEGSHASAHDDHLEILTRQGYVSLKRENKLIDMFLKGMNRFMPRFALAMTCALEHFTAMLAHQMFKRPDLFFEPAHEDFKPLFKWHAAEEIEHKAVAFDTYQYVDGSYLRRVVAMVLATVFMVLMIPVRMSPLLYRDGRLLSWKTWRNGLPFLFGRQGKLVMPWRHYIQFYRRDFHPWNIQDLELITDFRRSYESGEFTEAIRAGARR